MCVICVSTRNGDIGGASRIGNIAYLLIFACHEELKCSEKRKPSLEAAVAVGLSLTHTHTPVNAPVRVVISGESGGVVRGIWESRMERCGVRGEGVKVGRGCFRNLRRCGMSQFSLGV